MNVVFWVAVTSSVFSGLPQEPRVQIGRLAHALTDTVLYKEAKPSKVLSRVRKGAYLVIASQEGAYFAILLENGDWGYCPKMDIKDLKRVVTARDESRLNPRDYDLVKATRLAESYTRNPVEANNRWLGGAIRLVGTVRRIRDVDGWGIAELIGYRKTVVHLRFYQSERAYVARLKPGGRVDVICNVDGEASGGVFATVLGIVGN